MNKATYEELVKKSADYGLDTKDYNMVVARIKGEESLRKALDEKKAAENKPPESDHTVRNNAAYDNSDPKDFKAPPRTIREKAGYVNPDGERTESKERADSGKRIVKGFSNKNLADSYSINQKLEFGGSSITRAKAKSNEPTETVRAMRKTVHETALESARQKEIDKKRRARLG
jgi:hypothetical protein